MKWSSLQKCVRDFTLKLFYEIDPKLLKIFRDKHSSLFPKVEWHEIKFVARALVNGGGEISYPFPCVLYLSVRSVSTAVFSELQSDVETSKPTFQFDTDPSIIISSLALPSLGTYGELLLKHVHPTPLIPNDVALNLLRIQSSKSRKKAFGRG